MGDINVQKKLTLILASGSPRRRELLALLDVPFVVRPPDIKESKHGGEGPGVMARRLAHEKARAVGVDIQAGLVVAADTFVCLEARVLGKPSDADDAARMLGRLRGRPHLVLSGLTVIAPRLSWERTVLAETTVWMRDYDDEEIAAYVSSGDPLDKAGGYAIQHRGFDPVSRIAGCYANVMGLPLCHLYCLLREAGFAPDKTPVAACDRFNQRVCGVASQILGV
jgi:MAF protein